MRINEENVEYFKKRWGREPKKWSIEKLHDLYLRVKERNDNYRSDLILVMDRIRQDNFEGGVSNAIFKRDHEFYKYKINWKKSDGRWVGSYSLKDADLGERGDRLDYILCTDYSLGEEMDRLVYLHNRSFISLEKVRSFLSVKINLELNKIWKNKITPEIISISISGYKYYVEVEMRYGDWKKFHWSGISQLDCIEVS